MATQPVETSFEARHLRAVQAAGQGDYAEAERWARAALELDPGHAEVLTVLGAVLRRLGRPQEALDCYARALAAAPGAAATLAAQANLLNDLRRWDEALASAEAALAADPGQAVAQNARGNALTGLGRPRAALEAYEAALATAAGYFGAAYNRAKTLLDLGQAGRALAAYDAVLALDPRSGMAHMGRGHALATLRRWDAAAGAYDQAFALDPGQPFLAGARLHARMRNCDWAELPDLVADLEARIGRDEPVANPFALVASPLGPERQLQCARAYVRHSLPAATAWPGGERRAGPIRLGYYSADFHEHATAYLIAELIELHDRADFEVIGFSYGPATGDPMRQRLQAAFDRIYDVARMDDAGVVELSRQVGIDIALDLKGFTADFRPGLFAGRPAPVQVSYLGFPMTTGAPFIDYLIADPVLVGDAERGFYSETVARLPGSYQPNDRRRSAASARTTRADHGLPAEGLVLASFNGSYKITPDVFDVWMRLVAAVPDAVLWLLEDNPAAAANLRREAAARGVDPGRLVFAPFRPLPAHLERLAHADLFLDTVHCSAHTTASDALWAGLPVLTRRGGTFAGRVAASLLTAVGLPELIADTLADYEATALALARDPERLAALRRHLVETAPASRLFDTPRYAREIEDLYRRMHARRLAGLAPEPLS